ncbi:hypothetical protein Cadr_000026142 [Camelus dromedarius]|uniref:Uncharacterized protein n=1 Tax=Camelus dromedarius TaxID=9838 RepID=A0A5N4CDQ1_CAMDR|nr:hypothetical protein Cadr_000026142 [Camelus dromedarius]
MVLALRELRRQRGRRTNTILIHYAKSADEKRTGQDCRGGRQSSLGTLRSCRQEAPLGRWKASRSGVFLTGGCGDQPRKGDRTRTRASRGSTGRTALPEHEALAWAGGTTAQGGSRGPRARALRLAPAEGGAAEDNEQLAVLLPTRGSRFSPAILNQHFCGPPSCRHQTCHWPCISAPKGSRAAAGAARPARSCLSAQPLHSIPRKRGPLRLRTQRPAPLFWREGDTFRPAGARLLVPPRVCAKDW